MAKLDEMLKKSTLSSNSLVLLFLDMDGFKGINDTFGHEVGDKALIEFSDRIKGVIRSTDISCRLEVMNLQF
jgi:diguanylate cyclase (GGDEF)-like protein